ncbi:MAG TPA: ferredoxin reductase [Polyangiaceae bacterium]|jgi:ferredoxin-NADP reductase
MAAASRSVWSHALDVVKLATTPLAPSDFLELVAPLQARHSLRARIESVREETADARTLTLRPARGWSGHRAGQFAPLGVTIEGRILRRTYSISSAPERRDGCITVTVKAVPGGRVSTFLTREAKPGDYVTLGPAQGEFVVDEARDERRLFLTAGSGVTPVASIVRALAERGRLGDAIHVHYAPRATEAIFGAELQALAARHPGYRYVLVSTREGTARNRFTREALDAAASDWRARSAWACGPRALLDEVESCFAAAGRSTALNVERFQAKLAPSELGASEASGGRVRFGRSKRDVEADGRTPLLRVAEGAGVNAPHGCRMGICHSCDATMVSGCVRDLRTGKRIEEPGSRIQVCVCAAAGDVEIAL